MLLSLWSLTKLTSPNMPLLRVPSALSISILTSYVPPELAAGFMIDIVPVFELADTAGTDTETVSPTLREFINSSETLTSIVTFDVSTILKGVEADRTVPASTLHSVTYPEIGLVTTASLKDLLYEFICATTLSLAAKAELRLSSAFLLFSSGICKVRS